MYPQNRKLIIKFDKSMKKVRAAIVGYGNIGHYVLQALQAAPDFEIAGVVRRAGAENRPAELNDYPVVKDIKEPKKVEMELWKIIPPEEGNDFCHRLVEHGRDVCTARTNPHCDRCVLNDICATGKKLMKAEQKTK